MDEAKEIEERIKELRIRRDELDVEIGALEKRLEGLAAEVGAGRHDGMLATGQAVVGEQLSLGGLVPDVPDVQDGARGAVGIISKSSPAEEKYRLFVSLFAGRPDVHAQRWESAQSGRVGYSPACRNSFAHQGCTKRKEYKEKKDCITCAHRAFYPIELDDFIMHTQGKKDNCSDVIGAYPMDSEGMCTFIVADFDDENRKAGEDAAVLKGLDSFKLLKGAAIAFRKTCLAYGVPAYLEVSRSGNGMHTWIFFTERIFARKARQLCSLMLTLAMNENPDVRFNSYDRLIPSQDTLPGNGLGNLVALPFQGRAGRQGHSIFVDEEMLPYPDQWEYLSVIRRMSAKELEAILGRHGGAGEFGALLPDGEDEDAAEPWEKKKPPAGLAKDDANGEVLVVSANMVHVAKKNLSQRATNRVRRLAAFQNPAFYKAQANRLSTRKIPRVITVAEDSEEYISVPRGAGEELRSLFDEAGIHYRIEDKTESGNKIKARFVGELRVEQKPAADSMLADNIGVLAAAPAFGKTVIGTWLIANRGVNALVLVYTKPVFDQWKESLNTFLDIDEKPPEVFTPAGRRKKTSVIGEYSGARKSLSGIVDIATIQSLHHGGEVKDFIKDYGFVIIDECHHIPAVSIQTVLRHANAKYICGLTATPRREDGLHVILFLECGPIRYRVDAKAEAAKRPFEHFMVPRFTEYIQVTESDERDYNVILNGLAVDETRNGLIVDDIASSVRAGRRPLVLSERVEHVCLLVSALEKNCKNVIMLTGSISGAEKREAKRRLDNMGDDEEFVIVATGKFIGEGFDYARLDTLFLTMPIKARGTITQYTGRLHRLFQGKTDVTVYDYVDVNVPMLERMYHTRVRGYKSVGYKTIFKEWEKEHIDIIFGTDEYWDKMMADIGAAKNEIIISSPLVSEPKVDQAMPVISAKLLDRVSVTAIMKPAAENSSKFRTTVEKTIGRLSGAGAKVVCEPRLNQRYVVIDRRIVWYGSINPLGFSKNDENMVRLDGKSIAKALLGQKFGREPEKGVPGAVSQKQISLFDSK